MAAIPSCRTWWTVVIVPAVERKKGKGGVNSSRRRCNECEKKENSAQLEEGLTSIAVKLDRFVVYRLLLVPWTMHCWLVDVDSLDWHFRRCLSNRHEVHFVDSPDRMDYEVVFAVGIRMTTDDRFAVNMM